MTAPIVFQMADEGTARQHNSSSNETSRRSSRLRDKTQETSESFDISEYLDSRCDFENNVERSSIEIEALTKLDVTKKYYGKQNMMIQSFISGISAIVDKNGVQKWEKMLESVPNPFFANWKKGSKKMIQRCLVVCSGPKSILKRDLANEMFKDWQTRLKLIKEPKDDKTCPFYQPSSQNSNFRAFLSHLKKTFEWDLTYEDFKGYPGCLNAALETIYEDRFKEWVRTRSFIFIRIVQHLKYICS